LYNVAKASFDWSSFIERNNEQVFGTLLNKVLPMHITAAGVQNRVYRTEEEVRALCPARGVPFCEVLDLAEPARMRRRDMAEAATKLPVRNEERKTARTELQPPGAAVAVAASKTWQSTAFAIAVQGNILERTFIRPQTEGDGFDLVAEAAVF
jgi:hypothetical protein